jgi:hypothetical protein
MLSAYSYRSVTSSCDREARSQHNSVAANRDNTCNYIDRSFIQGHTGAAAVWPARQQTRSAYMGPETTSTVYAAELQGICLTLAMLQTDICQGSRHKQLHIFTDNQAEIRSVVRPEGRSGHILSNRSCRRPTSYRQLESPLISTGFLHMRALTGMKQLTEPPRRQQDGGPEIEEAQWQSHQCNYILSKQR